MGGLFNLKDLGIRVATRYIPYTPSRLLRIKPYCYSSYLLKHKSAAVVTQDCCEFAFSAKHSNFLTF